MYVVHHNTLSDSFRIRIVWFQPKQDSDGIRISFFRNRIGSDRKNPLSDHLCTVRSLKLLTPTPLLPRLNTLALHSDSETLLTFTKRLIFSTPQRKCSMSGRPSQKCVSLAKVARCISIIFTIGYIHYTDFKIRVILFKET